MNSCNPRGHPFGPSVVPAGGGPVSPDPTPTSLLQRVGQFSPLWLGIAYCAATCVGMLLQFTGLQSGNASLRGVGAIIAMAALLLLYIVVIWYRDDDTLAAGVLLALTVLIGGLAATSIASGLVQRSFVGGLAVLTFGWMRVIVTGFLLIPISAVVVWLARLISGSAERVTAPGHGAHPAGARRPYRSAWDRREAKLNEKKTD